MKQLLFFFFFGGGGGGGEGVNSTHATEVDIQLVQQKMFALLNEEAFSGILQELDSVR
jgi:hypothetical protein